MKTYVELLFRETIVPESSLKQVASRDPRVIEVPRRCYAFRFFDQLEGVEKWGDEDIPVASPPIHQSNLYYTVGVVYTFDDVIRKGDEWKWVAERMWAKGWRRVIELPGGEVMPFGDGDTLLIPAPV